MKTTSIDHPLFIYDPRNHDIYEAYVSFWHIFILLLLITINRVTDNQYMYRDGILFLGVDNLPTEFPREATQWFGDHLLPYLEKVVKSDPNNKYHTKFIIICIVLFCLTVAEHLTITLLKWPGNNYTFYF